MTLDALTHIAEEEVRRAMHAFPPEVQKEVEAVPVFFEARPNLSDLASGLDPDTLGLFDDGSPAAPTPHIRLWLENLWDYSDRDEKIFREEVCTTFLHEVGHLLGWDEADLDERGLG